MLGLAILTLILLIRVMLLLVGPLLLILAQVTVLAFNHRDFIGTVLARVVVHSFQLILSKDSSANIRKIKVLKENIPSDNQN